MNRRKPPAKRAYLSRSDRRQALLDVAATVVEEKGWPALSMIAVAEAGNISRQLVYQHFSSVDELMADTMSHLFRGRYENIRSNVLGASGDDLAGLLRVVHQLTFDDRPARVRALWQMMTATHTENAETGRMGARLRQLLSKLWTPMVERQLGLDQDRARAMAWMLNMAYWGAQHLVHDGDLSKEDAIELFTWMMLRLQGNPAELRPRAGSATVAASTAPAPAGPAARKRAAEPAAANPAERGTGATVPKKRATATSTRSRKP